MGTGPLPPPPDIVRSACAGHAVVPSWYAEATTVLDLDGKPRPATEQHQILESAVGADGFRIR